MFCHEEPALKLAALALQAERGDCSSSPTTYAPRVRVEDYVPARVSMPSSLILCTGIIVHIDR